MAKTLKVGVIGVGGIANTHFPGWEQSPHAEVVALSDVSEEVLNRIGDKLGVKKRYDDPQDLIADPDIDIVDVCTPNGFHAPLTIAALEAGKHVICEKPLAPTPDEIRQMMKARDKAGKLLMTAQHFRWDPRAKALKAELDKGTLGDVYHARSWMLRRHLAPVRPGFINKKLAGGGPCIDIGVHILDLTLWMMGNPKPVTVTGVTQNKLAKLGKSWSAWGGAIPADKFEVEEFAGAFVRFEDGQTLIMEVSWLLHHNTLGEDMQMWLYGTDAGVHWPSNEFVCSDPANQQMMQMKLQVTPSGPEAHAAECMAFAEIVLNGGDSPVPAEQSLDVISILDGLYRSADSGAEVRL